MAHVKSTIQEPGQPQGASSLQGADAPGRRLDVDRIRSDFPLLARQVHGRRLVYLDSAASSQRPRAVLQAMDAYYETTHANVHRGVYAIAEEADRLYEQARVTVGHFIGAPHPAREVVFTKNATEAVNLVAFSWGRANLKPGDAIVLTEMEHHSNLVPWLVLAADLGLELRYLRMDDSYRLDLSSLDRLVEGAKLVTCTVMSNVLGTIPPFASIAEAAHSAGAVVLADGAQSVPHHVTDVGSLGCDFLAFSSHKMLGPTGIGVLWGREDLLDAMPPFMTGGGMIRDVKLDGFVPDETPGKFEAGTPPIAEAIGLAEAIRYLTDIGMTSVEHHERHLTAYAEEALAGTLGADLRILGPAGTVARGGVLSLAYRDIHPHDLAQVLDESGVCIRAGHHCAKPLMRRLGVSATARASLYVYNDESDVDALAEALGKAGSLFG